MVSGESLHLAGLLCPLCSASGSLHEFLTLPNIIEITNIGTHPLNSLEMLCTITLSYVVQGKLEVGLALHSVCTAKEEAAGVRPVKCKPKIWIAAFNSST